MLVQIKHRYTGSVLFEAEAATVAIAIRKAREAGANLSCANLSGANLSGADLSGANLYGANLSGANLSRANLSGANLYGANLSCADLSCADLSGANLSGANLYCAKNIAEAVGLDAIRNDLWAVLIAAPREVAGLLRALRKGRVNGSAYEGPCACLVGTIANVRGCDYRKLDNILPDPSRLSERWFLGIRTGDTPDKSPIAKLTEQWIVDWQNLFTSAVAAVSTEPDK